MAVLLSEYLVWLAKRSYAPIRIYIGLLCTIGVVLTGLLVALRAGAVPDTLFHGRHAADNIAIVHALAYQPLSVADICWISMPLIEFAASDCSACSTVVWQQSPNGPYWPRSR